MGPKLTQAEGFILGVGAPIAPHRRSGDCVWCECQCGVRLDLLDNHIVLTGVHRTPLRSLLNNTVGANCVRPQKPDTITMSGLMHILEDYSQYIPKSRYNPVDSESRGHKRISAKWACQPVW